MWAFRCLLPLIFLSGQLSLARAAEQVDLLLVLASDVSRSVDHPKFVLQRQGYAAGIANPKVLAAIGSGAHKRIAISYVEWAGWHSQKVVVDWTAIGDEASAKLVGDQLQEAPRSFADRTSISGGLYFAMRQLEHPPYQAARRAIDVSGDGTNNSGPDAVSARDAVLSKDVTINGLVIRSPPASNPWLTEHTSPSGGLERYYRDNVIGGPGAFVVVAQDFDSFGQAIVKKLVAEIAALPPEPVVAMQKFRD